MYFKICVTLTSNIRVCYPLFFQGQSNGCHRVVTERAPISEEFGIQEFSQHQTPKFKEPVFRTTRETILPKDYARKAPFTTPPSHWLHSPSQARKENMDKIARGKRKNINPGNTHQNLMSHSVLVAGWHQIGIYILLKTLNCKKHIVLDHKQARKAPIDLSTLHILIKLCTKTKDKIARGKQKKIDPKTHLNPMSYEILLATRHQIHIYTLPKPKIWQK